ncbi:MAG: hypothetical protein ACRDLK_07850, partial [Gaiellaceae bacterium]
MPRRPGHWLIALRAGLVVVAAVDVALTRFPPGYRPWAWGVVAYFALWTVASGLVARMELDAGTRTRARVLAIAADGVVAIGFVAVFSYQASEPYQALYLIPIAEAALRFGLIGGLGGGAAMVSAVIVVDALGPGNEWRGVAVRIIVGMLAGLVIGRLRDGLILERSRAEIRAAEAEQLRDALGRRVDVLEAANRVARALASSLEIEQAFGAFIRELRGLVAFERTAVVLIDGESVTTMATAGRGADEIFPPGSVGPLAGSVLEPVLDGRIVVRRDLAEREFPEDELLVGLGLRSELVAPLLLGARPIG